MSIFAAVIFDLGDTLIRVPWDVKQLEKGSSRELSKFESIVKVSYRSLVRNGLRIDWPAFYENYLAVRAEQIRIQKETKKEYDMRERISKTLIGIGIKTSPDSELVKRALEDQYATYIDQVEMEREIPQILHDLRLRYKLGLITNFAYPASIHGILSRFDLRKFFEVVVISGEVGWVKPSPKIFYPALSALDLRGDQCIFVGDDPEADVKGAKGVGMKTVFVSNRGDSCKDADTTILRIAELPRAIKEMERVSV